MDFDALVLGPAMAAFAQPIVFAPAVSQPGAPAYPTRGVFAQKQVQVQMDEGVFTDVQPTLGIRLAEFADPPKRGDHFLLGVVTWFVRDIQPDGQGGADLVLTQESPL